MLLNKTVLMLLKVTRDFIRVTIGNTFIRHENK